MSSSQNILQSLAEALPDPVIMIGAGQKVLAGNGPARQLLPILRGPAALAMVLRAPDILAASDRILAGGAAETVMLHERVPVERLFRVHIAPFRNAETLCAVLTLQDLTDARRVERMRVDFIANASHELRTPLASLLGFIETLQGPARDDASARARFLMIMREQGQRMARLIDGLLSLSQIERQQHVRPQARIDMVDILRHCVDALRPLAQENRIDLELVAPEQLELVGDRDEIMRVAENLIENAIKYGSNEDGLPARVTVTIAREAHLARLSVRDDGAGIAPEHVPRLTERFYRVDTGKSRAKGGTGLGLALVKHIVARHRGQLKITSQPGEGAEFVVELPLAAE